MSKEIKKSTNYTIGCTSWIGALFSLGIIAIRAFQPNATPIETWSIGSWILMLLPVFIPMLFWIAFAFICLLWATLAAVFSR